MHVLLAVLVADEVDGAAVVFWGFHAWVESFVVGL